MMFASILRTARTNTKNIAWVLASVALLSVTGTTAMAVVVGESAPPWHATVGDAQAINNETAERGTVMLFWASWCPYCSKLMPHIEAQRVKFESRGVKFYAFNIWEDSDAAAYLRTHEYGFELVLQAEDIAKIYGVKGTPGLIVVDADQQIRYVRTSGTAPEQVGRDLDALLSTLTGANISP